jgi:histidine triad (HIT) family protein
MLLKLFKQLLEEKKVDNIFKKILKKEIPAKIVYEDDVLIVIHDIAPRAPVHLLIIPRESFISLQDLTKEDCFKLMPHVTTIAQKMAKDFGIEKSGYRFITNSGPNSGQEVDHLHFHLLGGDRLGSIG